MKSWNMRCSSSSTNQTKNGGGLKSCSMTSASSTNHKRNPGPRIRSQNREDEYEGPKRFCHCGVPAPRWTSWTTNWNPGRRFFGCRYYYQEEHCDFFDWYDKFRQRELEVIRMLLDETEMVHGDGVDDGYDDGRSFLEELDAIHGEIRKMRNSHDLNAKQAKRSELKFKIAMGTLLLKWVFLFVLCLGKA